MIHLTIDHQPVCVEEGTTILEAARKANISIPTLCYHEDQQVKAVCRICVVEVEGMAQLPTACSTPAAEGMVVHTASPKVLKARKNILSLIFARHPQNCLSCQKSGQCELQKVAQDVGIYKPATFDLELRTTPDDNSSPSVRRNHQKCILCMRCVDVCEKVQGLHVMDKENRGFHSIVTTPYGKKLVDTNCVNCGQCIQACPTGALTIQDDRENIYHEMEKGKVLVVQVAPSVRVNLAEALGEAPGTVSTGRLVTALKRLGFRYVFDSDFSADLTIMEEGTELLRRLKGEGPLPMITSCCPAWVKYCETYAPDYTKHLSTAKSPQQMFGALIKTCFAEKEKVDPESICSVSIMPCTAKKFECKRPELADSGYQDVDYALTVQELARLIQTAGICFADLPDTPFDDPFGLGSGAGLIFGATGGVMEAALRTVHTVVTGRPMEKLEYLPVRGFEGIKSAEVDLDGTVVKVAVVHGLKNAKLLLDEIKAGKSEYHFIEIMACPGGCIGGGGNAPRTWKKVEARKKAIYEAEKELPVRQSHENPAIKWIYDNYLGEPNSHLAHKLLHTTYRNRQDLLR